MASQESQPFHWRYTELDDHNYQIRGRTLFFIIVLFAVVLLLTLLFLYTRWVCRFTRQSTTGGPHAPPTLPHGQDPMAINTLPIILHDSKSTTECDTVLDSDKNECCICLGVFEDGDKVKILPKCKHCYHGECIDVWLRTCSSCPLCRTSLRVDSVLPTIVTQ